MGEQISFRMVHSSGVLAFVLALPLCCAIVKQPSSEATVATTESLLRAASQLEGWHGAMSHGKWNKPAAPSAAATATKVKAVATVDNMSVAPSHISRKDWRPEVKEVVEKDLDWHYSPIKIYEDLLMQSRKNCRGRLELLASDLGTSASSWLLHSECHISYCNSWFWGHCIQDRNGNARHYKTWEDAR